MDKPKCLLTFKEDSLFGAGLQRLIASQSDLEVVLTGVASQQDVLQAVERERPRVVVFDTLCVEKNQDLVSRVLAQPGVLRVIVVGYEDSLIQVYDRQNVRVREVTDFMGAIYSRTGTLGEYKEGA